MAILDDLVASRSLLLYDSLGVRPSGNSFTVLASILLLRKRLNVEPTLKLLSLATGSKCLPISRLPVRGEALHDSHAEILARRGAVRWFFEEIARLHQKVPPLAADESWLKRGQGGKWSLEEGISCHLYISTLPCGDASMGYLAAIQEPEVAALKSSNPFPSLPPNTASRGRDNYSLLGVPRTKPGRADSPPTSVMSCSDKIAMWTVVGFQGALLSQILESVFLDNIVIGGIPLHMQSKMKEDCDRALWTRLRATSFGSVLSSHRPDINFTTLVFPYCRSAVDYHAISSNESICWVADSGPPEVLINGVRKGVGFKHRHLERKRPKLCKASILALYQDTLRILGSPFPLNNTYFDSKLLSVDYQNLKKTLRGDNGPLSGWMVTGRLFESFFSDSNEIAAGYDH